ncbi:MAG TPA: hypothetical protein VJ622_02395 [Acidimicrobiia bacterium]|nr:hypothetical protein [Acidimicrobiia bacterium]
MSDRRNRSDRRYRSGSRSRTRRGRRVGLLDFWQNIMDDTYDFMDDAIDRVRDDDYVDLEDEVDELREAVAALNAKLDRLLAQGTTANLDVRETTPAKPVAKTPA